MDIEDFIKYITDKNPNLVYELEEAKKWVDEKFTPHYQSNDSYTLKRIN